MRALVAPTTRGEVAGEKAPGDRAKAELQSDCGPSITPLMRVLATALSG